MGCDIHLYVERRRPDGTWEALKGPNPWISFYREEAARLRENARELSGPEEHEALLNAEKLEQKALAIESGVRLQKALEELEKCFPVEERAQDTELEEQYQFERQCALMHDGPEVYEGWIWDGRNYDLFAILANVRNGYGFAGIPTGTGFNPISLPKGLPDDVSDVIRAESERWGIDGHSHSWVTVRELIEYDWNQTTTHFGVLSENQYRRYKETGVMDIEAAWIMGKNVKVVSADEMDQIIEGKMEREPNVEYWVETQYKETYKDCVGDFYTKSLPRLRELAGDDLDSVRIVFWFDN